MNTTYYPVYEVNKLKFLAVCQCGTLHGPYPKVGQIPETCLACAEQAMIKKRRAS